MAKKFSELFQAAMQNIAAFPASVKKGLMYFNSTTNRPGIDDGTNVSQIMLEKHLPEARRATKVQLDDAGTGNEAEGILPITKGGTGIGDLTGQEGLGLVVNATEDGFIFGKTGGGGTLIERNQVAHGFVLLDAIYHNGTSWVKAQADNADTLAEYVITEVVDVDNFVASKFGEVVITAHGLTIGEHYFLSDSVAGGSTITEPSNFSSPLFYVEDANTVHIEVYRPSDVTTVDVDGSIPPVVDIGSGFDIDATLGTVFFKDFFANQTFTISNMQVGQTIMLICANTVGGSLDVDFNLGADIQFWAGGTSTTSMDGLTRAVITIVKGAANQYYFTAVTGMS